jgi:dCMP deaminase
MVGGDRNKMQDDAGFLRLAFSARQMSDDPKANRVSASAVGAVLVSAGRVIAQAANVIPPRLKSQQNHQLLVREADRYYFIEHAERAALLTAADAGESALGATLYCARFPCSDCARALVWFGVARVVTAGGLTGEEKWLESQRAALKILRGSGIKVRVLTNSSRRRKILESSVD